MNKSDLVESAVRKTGLSRRVAEEVIDSVLESMERAVAGGEVVRLREFLRLESDGRGGTKVRLGSRLGGKPGV